MDVLRWVDNALIILDQTVLPNRIRYEQCNSYQDVAEAIKALRVRGAPAIGLAGAFGLALAAFNYKEGQNPGFNEYLSAARSDLLDTRPTAVNLRWALNEMWGCYLGCQSEPLESIQNKLLIQARSLLQQERSQDERISSYGAELVPPGGRLLTICNAGGLATGGVGTALGIIKEAHSQGKGIHVYVPETRPVLQGARLTTWELDQAGVPYTLVTDNMLGYLFRNVGIDMAVVGADRVVANGDFANKIGTYGLAVLAAHHHCPLYVAAPVSTFDFSLDEGIRIPVEMRSPDEVRQFGGQLITIANCPVLNPSFDVTPHDLVTALITERGVIWPPFAQLSDLLSKERNGG